MKALIVENAYIKNSSQISQAERIEQELKSFGVDVDVKKNFNLAQIKDNDVYIDGKYDFCVYLDKDKSAARLLERAGLRLFNRAQAVEICDNKMLTHTALSGYCINMPDSIYAPLCYYADALPDDNFLQNVIKRLGLPLIAKTSYGSLGAGVYLIKDIQSLYAFERKNLLIEHFYQRFIDCGKGEDIRVIVIGGKTVCAMKRTNEYDFRSNIELGGIGKKFDANDELKSLCENVSKILKLDYCGIDVLIDKNGVPYICEVNSNAFFAAAEKVCQINIARIYAEYMLMTIKNLQTR